MKAAILTIWLSIRLIQAAAIGGAFLSISGCISAPSLDSANLTAGTGKPTPAASISRHTVKADTQAVVDSQVKWFIAAGILCLIASGALFYFGQILPAVKVAAAGLILPIFAVWWSHFYAVVCAAVLIGLALFYLIQHRAAINAIRHELDNTTSDLFIQRVKAAIKTP